MPYIGRVCETVCNMLKVRMYRAYNVHHVHSIHTILHYTHYTYYTHYTHHTHYTHSFSYTHYTHSTRYHTICYQESSGTVIVSDAMSKGGGSGSLSATVAALSIKEKDASKEALQEAESEARQMELQDLKRQVCSDLKCLPSNVCIAAMHRVV